MPAERAATRIVPAWPAPRRVRACMTTREGGTSTGLFGAPHGGGLNLGLRSGDDRATVIVNREHLACTLPADPAWLDQVHGTAVVAAHDVVDGPSPEADASWTDRPGHVCAVLVADCLPVLMCDVEGTRVAAAHAGWRGLAGGVLEATLAASGLLPERTMAWLGPAIGPTRFEVGDDVRDAFVECAAQDDRAEVVTAFRPHAAGKWLADLPLLARLRLRAAGVRRVHASGLCTVLDESRFYSYRRDGTTGRMAAMVWLEAG